MLNDLINYLFPVGLHHTRISYSHEDLLAFNVASLLKALTLEKKLKAIWFKVANEGSYSKGGYRQLYGLKLKTQGKLPGVADYMILGEKTSLCLELKTKKGTQSSEQKIFEKWCQTAHVPYRILRDIHDLEPMLLEYNLLEKE